MFSVELLMPMPIAIPPCQFDALQNTILNLRNVPPRWVPEEHQKALTDFLLLTPPILRMQAANRSVLVKLAEFGRIVLSSNDFAPWVELSFFVSQWQDWALQRRDGSINDLTDRKSLAVDVAFREVGALLSANKGACRREYLNPLEPEIAAWSFHSTDSGFSVFAILEKNELLALRNINTSPTSYIISVPTKALIQGGWRINKGYIIALGTMVEQLVEQNNYTEEWLEFDRT